MIEFMAEKEERGDFTSSTEKAVRMDKGWTETWMISQERFAKVSLSSSPQCEIL